MMRVEPSGMGSEPSQKRPREFLCTFHHVRTQQEGAVYGPGNESSPDTESALT